MYRDLFGGLIFVGFGAAGLLGTLDLPFGDARLPGPAMLPALLSVLMILFAAFHIVRTLRAWGRDRSCPAGGVADANLDSIVTLAAPGQALPRARGFSIGDRYPRVLAALLLTAVYVATLTPFGFLVSTFACFSALYALADENGLGLRPIVSGAVLTACSYVIFGVLLGVPFPAATLWK